MLLALAHHHGYAGRACSHSRSRSHIEQAWRSRELRHSAADEPWRVTGNIVLAQQLLRHENVSTTQAHLHPSGDDLREGMRLLDRAWQVVRSEEA
jgi:site-specific recombinase XerD